jgi:GDP-L-fucose synthase
LSSSLYSLAGKRVAVVGHRGMVGGALMRRLARESCEVVTLGRETADLRRQEAAEDWFLGHRPQAVFLAAARVGGIAANNRFPADFLYDNLVIATNVIEAARQASVEKLLFLGSSCIYPKLAPQPIREEALLSGPLEPTNEWYAVAKIAGIKLCQAYRRQYGCDFISAQPTNVYGPGDNFDLETGHVVAALIRKAHEAKASVAPKILVWGSGSPKRELLYVDDLADALVHLMGHYSDEAPINIGSGHELSIAELASTVARVVGFGGTVEFDSSMPDGTPRKRLDTRRLENTGWRATTDLAPGLAQTYQWYENSLVPARSHQTSAAA